MKLRFLTFALVATTGCVASAHMIVPGREEIGGLPASALQARATPGAVLPKVSAPPVRRAVLASEATRSPVPLLLSKRSPVDPATAAAWEADPPAANAVPPGKMTEAAAKAAIEADGYKSVRALSQGPDGGWKASALRGAVEVLVSVGSTGNVSVN